MEAPPEVSAAVINGDIPVLESYLSAGGDINSHVPWGRARQDTLLMSATAHPNRPHQYETIRFLLERGADPNIGGTYSYPLHRARTAQIAELLIAHGARVDARSGLSGSTALMWNCQGLDKTFEAMLVLLKHGASLDVRDASGQDVFGMVQQRLTGDGVASERRQALESKLAVLSAVRAAGSWKRYNREPSVKLWALRYLALAGRARAPPHFIRLFGAAPIPKGTVRTRSKRLAGTPLPDEGFAHVLGFWGGNH